MIATAKTIEKLSKLINEFFFSKDYVVLEDLTIYHPLEHFKLNVNAKFKVEFKNGRYGFDYKS